jgi:hypothetical protein
MAITIERYATNDTDIRETNISADRINVKMDDVLADCDNISNNTDDIRIYTAKPFNKRLVEAGICFKAFRKYPSVSASGRVYAELRTGSTKIINALSRLVISSGGPINVNVYEAPTILYVGTNLMIKTNLNRNSVITPTATLYIDPSGISGGTVIDQIYLPAIVGSRNPPAINRPIELDFIYKVNTTYIVEMFNNDNAANDIYYEFTWYEESI